MGQFSWLDCVTGKQIIDNKVKEVYVLIPEEFGGGHIREVCYDGYGHFDGYDIYDLVALWNRGHISKEDIKYPDRSRWGNTELDERFYQSALKGYENSCKRIDDFAHNVPDAEMKERYGKYYLREIGIDIACYDEDNARLEYPIKITYDGNAVYEDCEPSPSDPNQGWEVDDEPYLWR